VWLEVDKLLEGIHTGCYAPRPMSTALAAANTGDHGHQELVLPPDRDFGNASPGKIGMWIFLLSDAFSFGGLLLAYGILRGGAQVWKHAR